MSRAALAAWAVLAVVFGGAALAWTVAFLRRRAELARLASWTAVEGALESCVLEKRPDGELGLRVVYAWTQDGQRRTGSTLEHALSQGMDDESGREYLEQLRGLKAVTVRVGPGGASLLESGLVPSTGTLLGVAAVYTVLALAFGAVVAVLILARG